MENEEVRDYVEFEDEDGNTFELDVMAYFEYEGDEYVVLYDQNSPDEDPESQEVYILKVIVDGEYEEFVPVDEELMPKLIEAAEKQIEAMCECDEDCDCEHGHEHDCSCECGCEKEGD